MSELVIRFAVREDAAAIVRLVRELAAHEKLLDQVSLSEADILRDGFGDRPHFECLIAEKNDSAVGLALFFHSYSTFTGRPCLYLEDLIVSETVRGQGHGQRLVARLAEIALERGCARVDFSVVSWNPARKFYARLGAKHDEGALSYSLGRGVLRRLVGKLP